MRFYAAAHLILTAICLAPVCSTGSRFKRALFVSQKVMGWVVDIKLVGLL